MTNTKVFIITGKQGEGKTSLLKQVIVLLTKHNISLSGFYAKGYWDNNKRAAFDLININTNKAFPLCRKKENSNYGYIFNNKTIETGYKILKPYVSTHLYIIDEIGKYEIDEKIWYIAIKEILKINNSYLLITVRKPLLNDVIKKFGFTKPDIFSISTPAKHISNTIEKYIKP